MKLIKLIALFLFCTIMCSGCLSIVSRVDYDVHYPYEPTVVEVRDCLGVWWHDSKGADDKILDAYVMLSYPIWIIDFPFELVSDTLCCPYDIFCHKKEGKGNE